MKHIQNVTTADHIELEFETVGLASRFGAFAIDILIIVGMLIFLSLVVFLPLNWFTLDSADSTSIAVYLLLSFLLQWGYFVFFETIMRGQTPGKKALGLRVVRDDGIPIRLQESLVRNLLRAADMLPPPMYLVGSLAVLFNSKSRRLGDLAAGTMVVRERFALNKMAKSGLWGAEWMARLERGESKRGIVLPRGVISAQQIGIIEQYLARRSGWPENRRVTLATQIATPLYEILDRTPTQSAHLSDRINQSEELMREVMQLAISQRKAEATGFSGADKRNRWHDFINRAGTLLKQGKRGIRRLTTEQLDSFFTAYRSITTDLARIRSLGGDDFTKDQLNRIAVLGHNVLYRDVSRERQNKISWVYAFAQAVRRSWRAVLVSAICFFGPAVISYLTVEWYPQVGEEMVAEGFVDFKPAKEENLHDIPQLARPMVASAILTNNIQVTLLAFGFGLTFGLGTLFILIFNGVHLGAVAGWMSIQGSSRALWGWIMPHGATELIAIMLAGAAGFLMASALLKPGPMKRTEALRAIAPTALTIQLGCMFMLVIAGIIEGFVSPADIPYWSRIAIFTGSTAIWLLYFIFGGLKAQVRTSAAEAAAENPVRESLS